MADPDEELQDELVEAAARAALWRLVPPSVFRHCVSLVSAASSDPSSPERFHRITYSFAGCTALLSLEGSPPAVVSGSAWRPVRRAWRAVACAVATAAIAVAAVRIA